MSVIPTGVNKTAVNLMCFALFSTVIIAGACFADDYDNDALPKKAYSLGQEQPKPKPKVIIKEKIVIQCPPGSHWNTDVKRCQNEDGEDIAPAAKKKSRPRMAEETVEPASKPASGKQVSAQRDERYVYPNSKLRFKMVNCSMKGESVTCKVQLTNTSEGSTKILFGNFSITDENGRTYKSKSNYCTEHMNSAYTVGYGDSRGFGFVFPLVDASATTIRFSGSVTANHGSDALSFENIAVFM